MLSAGLYYYVIDNDYSQAVEWWQKAAENGDQHALYCLGICYLSGRGAVRNFSEAKRCFEEAAKQNHKPSDTALEILNSYKI